MFALPLERLARAGDLLITISSSGSSPNIVRALERAQALRLQIVTLSGRKPDNPSRRFGDVNVYIPNERYGWIESAHHVVLHYWLDQYLNVHGQGAVVTRLARTRSVKDVNVLITGGCGYVGTKLTQAMLARTPHHVTVSSTRSGSATTWRPTRG